MTDTSFRRQSGKSAGLSWLIRLRLSANSPPSRHRGLSFDRIGGEPPCFCVPHCNWLTVMLSEVEDKTSIRVNGKTRIQPNGSDGCSLDAYVWVRDAEALFASFEADRADRA